MLYDSCDLTCIIPTKDRPQKVANLLETLAGQTCPPGRVILIDGGQSIQDVVRSYAQRLHVEWLPCHPPGQIRQRNLGLSLLKEDARLVAFLDDDLELESTAIETMLAFWNSVEPETAGVGFNIVNDSPPPNTFLYRASLRCGAPGTVCRSGANVSFSLLNRDCRVQWLGGGYTVWRRAILDTFPQDSLKTSWAIGEDLRFSYPIGKRYPLYVCSGARVRHEHVYDQAPPARVFRYRGLKKVLAHYYFVRQNPELSRGACLWTLATGAAAALCRGGLHRDQALFQDGLGRLEALGICIAAQAGFADIKSALED